MGELVFLTGPVRSGKSARAVEIARTSPSNSQRTRHQQPFARRPTNHAAVRDGRRSSLSLATVARSVLRWANENGCEPSPREAS